MISEPILIIGGGLGGLALAQALHKQNIPFLVFERDPPDHPRSQGWCISLQPWLMDDFQKVLGVERDDFRALSPSAPLALHSEATLVYLPEDAGPAQKLFELPGGPDGFVRVRRSKLRDWLQHGIGEYIKWGKNFVRYEETADGVEAWFADGTSVKGSLLVGADGVGSHVRTQLLASSPLTAGVEPGYRPLGFVVGEIVGDKKQYQEWLKPAASFTAGNAHGDRRIFFGLKEVAEDLESATFYWLLGWHDDNAAQHDFWTNHATSEELKEFIQKNLDEQPIDPKYADPIKATPAHGIGCPPLRMRDMVPPELPTGRVTLIGDAVHPMVPFRGEGGNMAMEDALVLATEIGKSTSIETLPMALKAYEKDMTPRATKSVLRSRDNEQYRPGMYEDFE